MIIYISTTVLTVVFDEFSRLYLGSDSVGKMGGDGTRYEVVTAEETILLWGEAGSKVAPDVTLLEAPSHSTMRYQKK